MPRNKSPGLDGLTAEFYGHLWDLLCDDLLAVHNSVFSSGRLSASKCCGVVRQLYKKGDKEDLRNCTPISLLIHHDQTYCVPRRTIHDSTRLFQDIVDYRTLEGFRLPWFPWIRRRPSTGWSGHSSTEFRAGWKSVPSIVYGWLHHILTFRAGSLLTVMSRVHFSSVAECDRDVPCLQSCTRS